MSKMHMVIVLIYFIIFMKEIDVPRQAKLQNKEKSVRDE